MQVLQKAATILTQKKGTQHTGKSKRSKGNVNNKFQHFRELLQKSIRQVHVYRVMNKANVCHLEIVTLRLVQRYSKEKKLEQQVRKSFLFPSRETSMSYLNRN